MLTKFKDWWKEWWPFLSGAPIAIYTAVAYFTGARDDFFLFARMFRWELVLLSVLLLAVCAIHLWTPATSILRPRNFWREGFAGIKALRSPGRAPGARAASALLLTAILGCGASVALYAANTYAFVHERYTYLSRQDAVARAGEVELAQDLPLAISQYQAILERYPYNRFNGELERKIEFLQERHDRWRSVARQVAEFEQRYPAGMSSTRFDMLTQACRFVTNAKPCSDAAAYIDQVWPVVVEAQTSTTGCAAIASRTPAEDAWIYLDPFDQRWLGIPPGDGRQICRTLGLVSSQDLRRYLEERWRLEVLLSHPDTWAALSL